MQGALISAPQTIYGARLCGDELSAYTGSTLLQQLGLSLLAMILLMSAAKMTSILDIGIDGLPVVIDAIALVIAFTLLREYVRRLCFFHRKMGVALILDASIAFVIGAVLIVLALMKVLSAMSAHIVLGVICGLAVLIWILNYRSLFKTRLTSLWPDLKTNLSIGGWIFAADSVWTLSIYAYPWMIASLHGAEATAIWAAASAIMSIVNIPLLGTSNLLGVRIAREYAEAGIESLRSYIRIAALQYTIFAFLLGMTPLFFGEMLVTKVFGTEYLEAGIVIQLLGVNAIVSATWLCFMKGLLTIGRTKVDFLINFIPMATLFSLGWWLVDMYGPVGAAIGLTGANIASSFVRVFAFEIISRRMMEANS